MTEARYYPVVAAILTKSGIFAELRKFGSFASNKDKAYSPDTC